MTKFSEDSILADTIRKSDDDFLAGMLRESALRLNVGDPDIRKMHRDVIDFICRELAARGEKREDIQAEIA